MVRRVQCEVRGFIHGRAIVRAEEPHTFFSNLGQLEKRHHLETAHITRSAWASLRNVLILPSAVGQEIAIPSLQLMSSAYCVEHFLARFQSEVICIVQAEHAPCIAQLVVCQAFEGSLRRDGHEDR